MSSNPFTQKITSSAKRTQTVFSHRINAAATFFKLQILTAALHWNDKNEPAKVAFHQDHIISLLHGIPHLVPLGVCLSLIILNAKVVFLGNVSTTTRTALQFAAKLIEVWIQTSLGVMLLSFVRHLLFQEESLPLGTLLAPISIANVSYCWSPELWGSLTQEKLGFGKNWKKYTLLAATPAFIALAAIVGPSSAVLLIPREMNSTVSVSNVILDSPNAFRVPEINSTLL